MNNYDRDAADVQTAIYTLQTIARRNRDQPDFRTALTTTQTIIGSLLARTAYDREEPEQGNTCPKCGGHSFRLQATFDGTVDVAYSATDPDEFEILDTEPGDSSFDGPAHCLKCGWRGDLDELVTVRGEESEDDEEEEEPDEPDDDALTTHDHVDFFQYGKQVFHFEQGVFHHNSASVEIVRRGRLAERIELPDGATVEDAIRAYMSHRSFWPDAWFISDHGNAHRIDLTPITKVVERRGPSPLQAIYDSEPFKSEYIAELEEERKRLRESESSEPS